MISMTASEWVTGVNEGYRTKTIQYGNCTIEINRPILPAEELARREEAVRQVLRTFGRSINNYERV